MSDSLTPIITSKQCDYELKLLAQNLTHSKYSINAHRYYCIICYHYWYYIENFTENFPLPCRMLLGTTCLCMLLIIFEILSCTCMLWGRCLGFQISAFSDWLGFLPGKFHGQRSLVGYCAWGHKELDTTAGLILMMMMMMVCRWIFGKHLKLIN